MSFSSSKVPAEIMIKFMKTFMDREPVVFFSCALALTGVVMPGIIAPIRRGMGYATNQYDGVKIENKD